MVRQENRVTMVGVLGKSRQYVLLSHLLAFYLTQPTEADTQQWKNSHLL